MDAVEELCLILSDDGAFRGWMLYDEVHAAGFRHLTVQVIPVQRRPEWNEARILLHRRDARRGVGANQLDVCGGHVHFAEGYEQVETSSAEFLAVVSDDTALEEAREEVVCDPIFEIESADLHRFGSVGKFHVDTTSSTGRRNVEDSTVYIVLLPGDRSVRVREVVRGETQWVDTLALSVDALLVAFRTNEDDFSDGASRVLRVIAKEPTLERAFREVIGDLSGGGSPESHAMVD